MHRFICLLKFTKVTDTFTYLNFDFSVDRYLFWISERELRELMSVPYRNLLASLIDLSSHHVHILFAQEN